MGGWGGGREHNIKGKKREPEGEAEGRRRGEGSQEEGRGWLCDQDDNNDRDHSMRVRC